jgi:hypothetical protein
VKATVTITTDVALPPQGSSRRQALERNVVPIVANALRVPVNEVTVRFVKED